MFFKNNDIVFVFQKTKLANAYYISKINMRNMGIYTSAFLAFSA